MKFGSWCMIPFQPHPASILFTWSPNQPGLAAHWLGWLGRLGLTWTLPVILLLVAGDLSGSLPPPISGSGTDGCCLLRSRNLTGSAMEAWAGGVTTTCPETSRPTNQSLEGGGYVDWNGCQWRKVSEYFMVFKSSRKNRSCFDLLCVVEFWQQCQSGSHRASH